MRYRERACCIIRTTIASTATIVIMVMVWGCNTLRSIEGSERTAGAETQLRQHEAKADVATLVAVHVVDVKVLTAREAAMRVAAMPRMTDPLVEREIALYETLYHTAWVSNIGLLTEHYLLDVPDDPPDRWMPRGVSIGEGELLLRVLARLSRLNVPMRWTPERAAQRPLNQPVRFPATQHLATRLAVRIVERSDDGNTVRARLTDATAHVGGARQYITATWDGKQWKIERDRAFNIW